MKDKPISIEFRNISIPKATVDKILKTSKNPIQVLGLYTFYYYTAIWQKTNKPHCTTAYTAKGLKCDKSTIQKYKKQLINLRLIEDVRATTKNNRVEGYYIHVYFYEGSQPPKFPVTGKSGINAYSTNNKDEATKRGRHQSVSFKFNLTPKNKNTPQHRLSLQLFRILKRIVPAKNKGMPQLNDNGKRNWRSWHKSFKDLLDQEFRTEEQISKVIEFYGDNINQKYTPKLYSAKTFCEEIHRIENLMGELKPITAKKIVNGHDLYEYYLRAKGMGDVYEWLDNKGNEWEMYPDGMYTRTKPNGDYVTKKLDI